MDEDVGDGFQDAIEPDHEWAQPLPEDTETEEEPENAQILSGRKEMIKIYKQDEHWVQRLAYFDSDENMTAKYYERDGLAGRGQPCRLQSVLLT